MLSPPTLTPHASNRVCNALALLQCVASHAETKSKLMYGTYANRIFASQFLTSYDTEGCHIILEFKQINSCVCAFGNSFPLT